jgi:hypothetical protein
MGRVARGMGATVLGASSAIVGAGVRACGRAGAIGRSGALEVMAAAVR